MTHLAVCVCNNVSAVCTAYLRTSMLAGWIVASTWRHTSAKLQLFVHCARTQQQQLLPLPLPPLDTTLAATTALPWQWKTNSHTQKRQMKRQGQVLLEVLQAQVAMEKAWGLAHLRKGMLVMLVMVAVVVGVDMAMAVHVDVDGAGEVGAVAVAGVASVNALRKRRRIGKDAIKQAITDCGGSS